MDDEKILDAPKSGLPKTTSSLASYQNSALRTEAVLGAFWLGGWVWPYVIAGQWVWGMPVYVFFGIGLGFVYLLIPTLLFKSRGWKRHFFAHFISLQLILVLTIIPFLAISTSDESEIIALLLAILGIEALICALLFFLKKQSPRGNSFFKNIFFRLVLAMIFLSILLK